MSPLTVILISAAALLAAVFIVQLIHTMALSRRQNRAQEAVRFSPSWEQVGRLSGAIKIRTESHDDPSDDDEGEFTGFKKYLKKSYPLFHKKAELIFDAERNLIYKWPAGSSADPSLLPVCHMSHYDVVGPGNVEEWQYPPFSGEVAEDAVWGRGTQDIKLHLISLIEAAQSLMDEGIEPPRDIYFAFGGDEEVCGERGGRINAEFFRKKGIRFEYVLDEGAVIVDGAVSFIRQPLALFGIAEKGRITVRLSATGKAGHSATPPAHTAVGLVSRAVSRIERKPFRPRFTYSTRKMLTAFAASAPAPLNFFLANNRFYGPLLKAIMLKNRSTGAMFRTTQAVTVIRGGTQENVIPEAAEALINIRILPGETQHSVLERLRKVVKDPRVSVQKWENFPGSNPVKDSSVKSEGYRLLNQTLSEVLPGTPAAPYMVTASTDSRYFCDLSDAVLRFTPVVYNRQDLKGIHGVNEKISLENYGLAIEFLKELMKR